MMLDENTAAVMSPPLKKSAKGSIASLLQSCCEESGAEYALFWSFSRGRLCVSAAWAKYVGGKNFISDSCRVMMEPGVGAVGSAFSQQCCEFFEDVRYLSADLFIRNDIAQNCNIQSLLVMPWNQYGVLEFGAHKSWQVPTSLLAKTFMGKAEPSAGVPLTASWEAVLWKRSRFLRAWRRRLFKLVDMGDRWQLSSWDVPNAKCTGVWNFERSLPYIQIAPDQGFSAMMQLDGLSLAADSEIGANAMEELATIFNGRLMRPERCQEFREESEHPPTIPQTPSSEGKENVIEFERPQCDNCGSEAARGSLIAQPVNGKEIRRWLCKGCFISTWPQMCQGDCDGRFEGRPQWMALTDAGALINSTPPQMQRYSRVN